VFGATVRPHTLRNRTPNNAFIVFIMAVSSD
jgi:hypothetical protein